MGDSGYHFQAERQPTWATETDDKTPLLDVVAYKGTKLGSDVVVKRRVVLFRDRLRTFHDPDGKTPNDYKTWHLDHNCELLPRTTAELKETKRGIRPRGTWAITAAIQGVQETVDVFEVTIDWPSSWAAAGYTSLQLGFESRERAEAWHTAVAGVLQRMRDAKSSSRTISGQTPLKDRSGSGHPDALAAMSAPINGGKGSMVSPLSRGGGEVEAPAPSSAAGLGAAATASGLSLAASSTPAFQTAAPLGGSETSQARAAQGGGDDAAAFALSDDYGCDTDDEADGECSLGEDGEDEEAPPDDERWVPYRQTNGVAIYYHPSSDKEGGGEYMVSSVIRGRPHRVASALMRLRSHTTVLGPAAHVEVLQPAGRDGGKEVLRLVLTATGSAGLFCAPREVILERFQKDEEDGVVVILFRSVELPNEATAQAGTAGKGKNLFGNGLYKRPVRCVVAGGYTIAGLKGRGADSEESLVTAIVQLDLGGVCGVRSWGRPLAAAAGWTDSFLDRVLMSVQLLRDEVEQRRFVRPPQAVVASARARYDQDGHLVGERSAGSLRQQSASAAVSGPSVSGSLPSAGGTGRKMPRMASIRPATRGEAAALEAAVAARGQSAVGVPPIAEEEQPAPPASAAAASVHPAALDLALVQSLALMPRKYWSEIHVPGTDAPFMVRGPTYLKDRKKVPAGPPAFSLGSLEMVVLPPPGTMVAGKQENGVVQHVARFLPSVRQGKAPFSIIIHLVIPGSPLLGLLAVFVCDKHPSILGSPPQRPMEEAHDWQPFDFVLHKFVYGDDATRDRMIKLVPHIASGSWMIKQSVGTTPVILGKALKTTYHCTPSYIEVDIDISANSVANYVTGMVRGATSSLVIDIGFVLEGTAPWELPECLLGGMRLTQLDCKAAMRELDWSRELPL